MAQYGTTVTADAYFNTRLHIQAWEEATEDQRNRALAESSRRIDRLKFRGEKTDADQALEWPRTNANAGVDTDEIPDAILIATYESAYALLDGVDPDEEYENLSASSEGYSSVRTTYNRASVPEHFAAGIPSALAWRFLKPLLGNTRGIRLSRVS
jgi:hypothetical protein